MIEICIPCEVHGCVACGADGLGCSKCDNGYELIDGKCVGDGTPESPTPRPTGPYVPTAAPTKIPQPTAVVHTSQPPAPETPGYDANETISATAEDTSNSGDNSGSNASSKNKSKKTGLIVGVVVACVAVVAAIVVVVVLLIRRNSTRPAAIKTDDISGEMANETNGDSFKSSQQGDFNSMDNPIFAANTSENNVIEDPFINDFEEGRI